MLIASSFMTIFVLGDVPLVSAGTTTMFTDSFEGAFPGAWSVGDNTLTYGEDYWGDTSYRYHGGFTSAWCAAIGGQNTQTLIFTDGFEGGWFWTSGDWDPASGIDTWGIQTYDYLAHTGDNSVWCSEIGEPLYENYYDNNMKAYMYRTVDLSSYDSATLSFWYASTGIEPGYDYLQVMYHPAGTTWSEGSWIKIETAKYDGWNDWTLASVSIPNTANAIGFYFYSDDSFPDTGVFVDDVTLYGTLKNSVVHSYDRYMDAYMTRTVDLSGYTSASLSYWYWLDYSDGGYDYLQAGYRVGSTWTYPNKHTSGSSNWVQATVDIPDTANAVGFRWYSDSVIAGDEGAYIDDVILTAVAEPEYILDFSAFPAYPYNHEDYYFSSGRYVGCGPTTGAMILGYFQHHFGLTDLLDNPGTGVNEGLDTAWELHYNYMHTNWNGFGDPIYIKPGLEDYASDRGYELQVVAHAPTWENPTTSWYNDYGNYGDAWMNDGNFWVDLGGDNVGIDVDLFCDFLSAKFSEGITVMLTVDGSSSVMGADHWIPCVGFDRIAEEYYCYDTWTTTLHSADIISEDEGPGEADFAINFVRTIEYIPSGPPMDNIVVVRGTDNRIYYRQYSGDWGDWKVVPSGTTCDTPAASVQDGKLYMVVRGMDGNSLYYGWVNLVDDSFSGWSFLSGATPSKPTLVYWEIMQRLILVVRGTDNHIYLCSYNILSDTWSGWSSTIPGSTNDSPAAAVDGDYLHLVVRGMDDNLYYMKFSLNLPIMPGWTWISGTTPSAPTLTCNFRSEGDDHLLCLVVRGSDNGIYLRSYDGSWSSWTSLPGGTNDAVGVCIQPSKPGLDAALHMVVRGMTGGLYHGKYDLNSNSFLGWSSISGETPSPPTLVS